MIKVVLFSWFKSPPSDAPIVDTAEQVYISSLALLKVRLNHFTHNISSVNITHGSGFYLHYFIFLCVPWQMLKHGKILVWANNIFFYQD
jgi:hypothetical protein